LQVIKVGKIKIGFFKKLSTLFLSKISGMHVLNKLLIAIRKANAEQSENMFVHFTQPLEKCDKVYISERPIF